MSEGRIGGRARRRQQARTGLALFPAQAFPSASEARRGPARPCRRSTASAAMFLLSGRFLSAAPRLRSRISISEASAREAVGRAAAGLLLAARSRRRGLAREGRPACRSGSRPVADRARREAGRGVGAPSVGRADPLLDRLCALILSSADGGYRSALLNTLARGARHLDGNADKPAGRPLTAGAEWLRRACWSRRGAARRARRSGPRARLVGAIDDGGLVSRSPLSRLLLVDRLGLLRACYQAAKQTFRRHRGGRRRLRWRRFMASPWAMALVELAGLQPGKSSRLTALIEGCGLRARPLRQARGWGYQRMSALGTIVVSTPRRRRRRRWRRSVGLDARVRIVGRRAAPGRQLRRPGPLPPICPTIWSGPAHDRRAQHAGPRRHQLHQHPRRRIARQGRQDVAIDRSETMTEPLEASHDGYVRAFGLIHKRSLMLGNDGKELRGADQLIAQGPQEDPRIRGYAVRFHLAPGVEPTVTADGMGAILRSEARRRGTSAAAAAISRPRRACGSTAAASRSARASW